MGSKGAALAVVQAATFCFVARTGTQSPIYAGCTKIGRIFAGFSQSLLPTFEIEILCSKGKLAATGSTLNRPRQNIEARRLVLKVELIDEPKPAVFLP
jgi:hypothetical protein